MPSVIVIPPDGDPDRRTLSGLAAMRAAVGGTIEVIALPDYDMIVNEEAVYLDLPCNPLATRLAKRELARVGRTLLTADGWVCGTVFLVGKPDRAGDETDCPEVDLSGV